MATRSQPLIPVLGHGLDPPAPPPAPPPRLHPGHGPDPDLDHGRGEAEASEATPDLGPGNRGQRVPRSKGRYHVFWKFSALHQKVPLPTSAFLHLHKRHFCGLPPETFQA